MQPEKVSLSEWIMAVRAELTDAAQAQIERQSAADAAGRVLAVQGMKVKEIRLELEVSTEQHVGTKLSTEAKLKFWVFTEASAGAEREGRRSVGSTQRIVLTLEPLNLNLGGSGEKEFT
jgi:hypothetical protein